MCFTVSFKARVITAFQRSLPKVGLLWLFNSLEKWAFAFLFLFFQYHSAFPQLNVCQKLQLFCLEQMFLLLSSTWLCNSIYFLGFNRPKCTYTSLSVCVHLYCCHIEVGWVLPATPHRPFVVPTSWGWSFPIPVLGREQSEWGSKSGTANNVIYLPQSLHCITSITGDRAHSRQESVLLPVLSSVQPHPCLLRSLWERTSSPELQNTPSLTYTDISILCTFWFLYQNHDRFQWETLI